MFLSATKSNENWKFKRRGRETEGEQTELFKLPRWSHTQSGTYTVFVASCCVVTQGMYNSNLIPFSKPPTKKKKQRNKKKRAKKIVKLTTKIIHTHYICTWNAYIYTHRMLYIYTNFIYTFTFHTPNAHLASCSGDKTPTIIRANLLFSLSGL